MYLRRNKSPVQSVGHLSSLSWGRVELLFRKLYYWVEQIAPTCWCRLFIWSRAEVWYLGRAALTRQHHQFSRRSYSSFHLKINRELRERHTKMSEDEHPAINLPWVEKYRPNALDELISHEDIINTIRTFIEKDKLPHLLFYGPPGTGKTSTILACAKEIYPPKLFNSMVLELNASDDRGIGIVRGQIMNFASTRTMFNRWRRY